MLVFETERKVDDQFILKNQRVSLRATPGTSYEVSEDILLEGNPVALEKQKFSIKAQDREKSALSERLLKEMQSDAEKFPDNAYALNNLGLAYLNQNCLQEALSCFSRAIKIKGSFLIGSLNLANAYLRLNRTADALSLYTALLNENPNDVRILINIGNLYFKNKAFDLAQEAYKKILSIENGNTLAFNQLAMLALIGGKYQEAISYLRKALQGNPSSAALNNNLGIAYAASGALDKAINALRVSLKLAPRYTNAIANLAFVLRQKNQLQEGIALIEEYLLYNESYSLRELISRFYVESNHHQKALVNLNKVLSGLSNSGSDTELARLENNIGVVYHKLRKLSNAREHYFHAVAKVGFDNPILVGNIIDLLFDTHKIEETKKYIDIFKERFPADNFNNFYNARYLYSIGSVTESVDLIRKFIQSNDSYAPAFILLGFILSEHYGNYTDAIKVYEQGLFRNPNEPILVNNLAYSYLMSNDIPNARRVLERVKGITNNICLIATRGLLKIKEGNLEDGSALYNYAAEGSRSEDLRKNVLIKKNIEVARYWEAEGNRKLALEYLDKATTYKVSEFNIYYQQALQLYEELKNLPSE